MDDDQVMLHILNNKRMEILATLALLLDYGEIDVDTQNRLVQRIDETFSELAERLTGREP